jgi:hypothetical protein
LPTKPLNDLGVFRAQADIAVCPASAALSAYGAGCSCRAARGCRFFDKGLAPRGRFVTAREMEMTFEPLDQGETTLDLIHQDHEAFAPNRFFREFAKAVEADLENR